MTIMMITVNGEARETTAGSVHALLTEVLGETPEAGTAVAINGDVVPQSAWPSTSVTAGDAVDILTAVQGG